MLPVVLAAGGCATTTRVYPGPKRPDAEVARIVSEDTVVARIDDREVMNIWAGTDAVFKLLPGPHSVGNSLHTTKNGEGGGGVRYSGYVTVCFVARKGRTYQTTAIDDGHHWRPDIIDVDGERSVARSCPAYFTVPAFTGPPQPEAALGAIQPEGARVAAIDGRVQPSALEYRVLPGRHHVAVLPTDRRSAAAGDRDSRAACFTAERGRTYVVRALRSGQDWRPQIYDEQTARVVGQDVAVSPTDCSPPPAPVAVAPGGQPGPAPAAGEVQPAASPAPAAPAENSPQQPEQPPVAAADAEAAKVRAVDAEMPKRPLRRRVESEQPLGNAPGNGPNFEIGAMFGGDTLVTATFENGDTENIKAGQGLLLTVGWMWTPLMSGNNFGAGAGFNIGWKVDFINASNASVTFSRFPLMLAAHALIPLDERWRLLVRAGPYTELAPNLSGDGLASGGLDFGTAIGAMGEAGFYYMSGAHSGLGLVLRYTSLHLSAGGASVDASNFGVVLSTHYRL
jgi:hypothetical protein